MKRKLSKKNVRELKFLWETFLKYRNSVERRQKLMDESNPFYLTMLDREQLINILFKMLEAKEEEMMLASFKVA